ncbi:MAG: ABC transporter permease [Candidatus Methanomethylophilaceae archaeon]|nr:ABC transporter permease [Candidatus Methanomethylophilaceae archaeon]
MSFTSKLDDFIMPKPKKEPEIPRPEDEPLGDGPRTGSGTWRESRYSATDEEAHRDVRYSIPSSLRQTLTVFMVQMKLFSKMRWTYILLFTALLIPIIAFSSPEFIDILSTFGYSKGYSTTKIAGLLFFLPLMLGLMTSIMCGTQMPTEFKERTAYMNIPLPLSRASFFFGKFLAGFVMCLGIFMFAYSMAIATAMVDYDTIFPDLILNSIGLTVIGVLAYSATAYTLGCLTKKGSSIFPFVLMSFAIPLVVLIICSQTNDYTLTLLPMFLGEAALGILGASMTGSVGMVILGNMDLTLTWLMAVIGVVWTVAVLAIGYFKTERREM